MVEKAKSLKQFLYENGLGLATACLFLVFMGLQFLAGLFAFNEEQAQHGLATISMLKYIVEPHFWAGLLENWESEFLQMGLLIVMSEFLRQKGSAQSRKLKDREAEEQQQKEKVETEAREQGKTPRPVLAGGWRHRLYSNSLLLLFSFLFLLSFAGHVFASYLKTRQESLEHGDRLPSFLEYLTSGQLWFESMQNWQSEFLAMFSIVVFSIWLRAKNSTESKPVGAAHDYTGH